MLTRTLRWTATFLAVAGAAACEDSRTSNREEPASPKPQPAAGTAAEATNTTSPVTNTNAVVERIADPLAGVANRDRITPDPAATKIDPPKQAALLTRFSTIVRESPRGSKVEVLETTRNVTEIARDGDYYLIKYPDPKGSNRTLAGWVFRDSLVGEASSGNVTPGAPQATGKLHCATGESHVRTSTDFCAKTCKADSDCSEAKGEVCDGIASKVDEKKNQLSDARYCVTEVSKVEPRGAALDHAADLDPLPAK
jgi:hypothetical protein